MSICGNEWIKEQRLRQIKACPWRSKLHQLPSWTPELHKAWSDELRSDEIDLQFPTVCVRQGFALSRMLQQWPLEPCQRWPDAPCSCPNSSTAPVIEETSGRREVIVEELSDAQWQFIDDVMGFKKKRERGGSRLNWKLTMAAAVTWATSGCGWNRIYLKKGDDHIGTALRQRFDRLDLDGLRRLQNELKTDVSLDPQEREELRTTADKLITHLNEKRRAMVKTASQAAG